MNQHDSKSEINFCLNHGVDFCACMLGRKVIYTVIILVIVGKWGVDWGGGHGGPMPPPPFGIEQALIAEVYCTLSAYSYSDAVHISIWITASRPANIKHSNLQLPRDSSVAVSHIQRLIPKGRGSEKWPYDESPKLQSSCHKLCMVMVVSDGLRSTLIWSKFKKFSWGSMPPDPLQRCALYVHAHIKKLHALRAPHEHTNPAVCVPPFFNLRICPCKCTGMYRY